VGTEDAHDRHSDSRITLTRRDANDPLARTIRQLREVQHDLQSGSLPRSEKRHWTMRARTAWIEAIETSAEQLEATQRVTRDNWLISAGVRSLDYYGVENTATGQRLLTLIYDLIQQWRTGQDTKS
jgi:hypothetical protein